MRTKVEVDILIVGCGSAGTAAAIAAAEEGMKVLVLEKNTIPGGSATVSEVGTICGAFSFNQPDAPFQYINQGFTKKFTSQLAHQSQTQPVMNGLGLRFLPYKIPVYLELTKSLLNKKNITVFYSAAIEKFNYENNKICEVNVRVGSIMYTISFDAIIDCSGNSIVSKMTQLPLINRDRFQAASQVFTLSNVSCNSETTLSLLLLRALTKGVQSGELDKEYLQTFVISGSMNQGSVSFKITIPDLIYDLEGESERLKTKARSLIFKLVNYLKSHVESFRNAFLEHIADEVGIRTSHRPVGKYILEREDVLSCKKWDNAIANGSWPIEQWENESGLNMTYFERNNYYQIPADCLISNTCDNLFFGGRNISATEDAIGSARVMGVCLQTGYAAGKLATSSVLNLPKEDFIESLQNSLNVQYA